MSTDLQLGPEQMDALREIGDIGAGNAATSPSQMMGAPVRMGTPSVKSLPVEDIAAEIDEGDEVVAEMLLGVEDDAPLGAAPVRTAVGSDGALMLESTLGHDDTPSAGDFRYIPTSEAPATVLDPLGLGE